MTQYELNFSMLVEQMLSKIADPAYRQIIVEVIYRIQWCCRLDNDRENDAKNVLICNVYLNLC